MNRLPSIVTSLCVLFAVSNALADEIHVKAGESIQKAIDSAPAEATLQIEAGTFPGALHLNKPLTLQGAGWDKTIIQQDPTPAAHTDAEKIALADEIEKAQSVREQAAAIDKYMNGTPLVLIQVSGAKNVTLRNLSVRAVANVHKPSTGNSALLRVDNSTASAVDCTFVGPVTSGIIVANASDVTLQKCLIAGVLHTGVGVADSAAALHMSECDVRNCYYTGIIIGIDAASIDHCRVSGSAWHGIRYDNCSPTITQNLIFSNARSGIYASGNTRATVRGNVFWRNEMDAISCWEEDADTVEENVVVGNLREGIAVLGNAHPTLSRNVIVSNPIGIEGGAIANAKVGGEPHPQIVANLFSNNQEDIKIMDKTVALEGENKQADPQFTNSGQLDFSRPGAAMPIAFASPWPIQPEETAIIPDTDTRDSRQWKLPRQ